MEFIDIPKRATDLTDQRFTRLIVLGPVAKNAKCEIRWLCQCDCGSTTVTTISMLRSGHTKSCGCYNLEQIKTRSVTHGMCYSATYRTWATMINRCTRPSNPNYPNYGGRGISVCDAWMTSFESFYGHVELLPKFGVKGMTLDRIDTNGNYEAGNLRWASPKEQSRNRRDNFMITHNGKTQCLAAWAEETGITGKIVRWRILKGWDVERALTAPVQVQVKSAARYIKSRAEA